MQKVAKKIKSQDMVAKKNLARSISESSNSMTFQATFFITIFPIVCNHASWSLHPPLESILEVFESEVTPWSLNRSESFFRAL
jgi:hypothetical protein